MTKKLMIFIPAYKAEKTIIEVIERIPQDVFKKAKEIFIADNDSKDNIVEVVEAYKKQKNIKKITVRRNEKNVFFGGNIKTGCRYGISKNYDIIAVVHSDGQYPPENIAELIKPIEEGKAQAVSGSRFLGNPRAGGMPLWRYLGNIFLTQYENIMVGHKLSEWHSGYRAYDLNALKTIHFEKCVNGYEWTTDVLLMLLSNDYSIAETAIPTHYGNDSTSPSIMRTFTYCTTSMNISTTYLFHRTGFITKQKYKKTRPVLIPT
jgi:glycosyltransferase involved in cell wall biosynthesis